MITESTNERRDGHRAEVLLQVSYNSPEQLKNDYITNFSQGGVFIRTPIDFERGEELSFNLSFPGLLKPIALRGVVRWCSVPDPQDPDAPEGIGVEFLETTTAQRQQIQGLMRTLTTPAAGSPATPDPATSDPATPDPATPDSEATAPQPQRPFTVLMVEDNDFAMELFDYAVRRFWKSTSGSVPLEVIHAADANQGLRELYAKPVDLAIIDHFMAGRTGCELVEQMRADERTNQIPIIVVSVGGPEIRDMAYECGADMFLDKPVMHKQLVATISKLLVGRRRGGAHV